MPVLADLVLRGPALAEEDPRGVRPEAVWLLLHLTVAEIARMRSEPAMEEELFRGKRVRGPMATTLRCTATAGRQLARPPRNG